MRKPDRPFTWQAAGAAVAALMTVAGPPAKAEAPPDFVRARLLAEDAALQPGATAWLAVELAMKPGWHTYWRNPGDAGQATEIDWHLPPGYVAGPIHWPVPRTFTVDIITSYGYADRVALLVPVSVPASAPSGGQADIAADVRWLMCEKVCIPGEAKLSLRLPILAPTGAATAARDPANQAVFGAARARVPRDLPTPVTARYGDDSIALSLPQALLDGAGKAEIAFLPFDDALIEHGARQELSGTTLTVRRGPRTGDLPASTDGMLLVGDANGTPQAFNISLRLDKQ